MRGAKRSITHVEKTSYTLYPLDLERLQEIGAREFTGPQALNISGIMRYCIHYTYDSLFKSA